MNIESGTNVTMPGAGNTSDGAMIIRVVKYPRLHLGLLVTSITLFPIFLIFALLSIVFNEMKDPGSLFLKNVFTPALFIICIVFFAMAFLQRKKMYVKPLGYRGYKDYLLTDEGIYTKIRTNVTLRVYKFYPWNSLKVYHVKDNKKVLGLKSWWSLIKLSDKRDFDGLKSIVFSRVPVNVPMVKDILSPARIGITVVAFIVCFFLLLAAGAYYSNIYNNAPDDGHCDVCGYRATKLFTGLDTYGKMINVHEYCDSHTLMLFVFKPWDLLTIKLDGMIAVESDRYLLLALLLIPWLIVALILLYLAIPRWYKTIPYY